MTRINLSTGKIIKPEEFKGGNPERQLQTYIEKYIGSIFECCKLKSFYNISGGQIDTLAITREGNPCIIEYKHKKEDTILNQIVFYYDWLMQKPTRFEFERIVKENKETSNLDVDWSKIRLICVAKEFSDWDTSLIKHLESDIECWSYTYHENELDVHLDPIVNQFKRQRNAANKNSVVEITLEDHRNKADKETQILLDLLREKIFKQGDDIKEGYAPNYIKYFVNTTFLALHIRKKWLIAELRVDENKFRDPKNITKDISNRGWTTTREFKIESKDEIEYAMNLIKQAYNNQ